MLIKVASPIFNNNKSYQENKPLGVLVIGLDEFVLSFYDKCEAHYSLRVMTT